MIKNIILSNFRGVKDTEPFPLFNLNSKCLVIYGENGVGKSSLIDAIEFGISKTVLFLFESKTDEYKRGMHLKHANAEIESCSVELEYHEKYKPKFLRTNRLSRKFVKGIDDKIRIQPSIKISEYSGAPLVLRRVDISKFWNNKNKFDIIYRYFIQDASHEIAEINKQCAINECFAKLNIASYFPDAQTLTNFYDISIDDLKAMVSQPSIKLLADEENIADAKAMIEKYESNPEELENDLYDTMLTELENEISICFAKLKTTFTKCKRISFVKENGLTKSKKYFELRVVTDEDQEVANPITYFSEANLDVLAIAIYIGMVKWASERMPNRAKLLILDDVFQSVDVNIRRKATEYVFSALSGFHFIFSTHDRIWKDNICYLAHKFNANPTLRWIENNGTGPRLKQNSEVNPKDVNELFRRMKVNSDSEIAYKVMLHDEELRILIECCLRNGSPREILYNAGYLFEKTLRELDEELGLNSVGQKGKDPTLKNFWDKFQKLFKKNDLPLTIAGISEWLEYRNHGCHPSEIQGTIDVESSLEYAGQVINFLFSVKCFNGCFYFIGKNLRCQCSEGGLNYNATV